MLSIKKAQKKVKDLVCEKDIFWIHLGILKICGMWSPYHGEVKKSYKSRIYEAYKIFYFTLSLGLTVYLGSLIYIFSGSISLTKLTLNTAYAIEYFVGIFKWIYLMKHMKTFRWLIDAEKSILRRENDKSFDTRLTKIKKTGSVIIFVLMLLSVITLVTTAGQSLFISYNEERASKEVCLTKYQEIYPIYKESNSDISNFEQNDIYENVYLMNSYLNQSSSDSCKRPIKDMPWLTVTPYNHEKSPYYELTILFEILIMYYNALKIIAVDMLIMSMLLYVKFQFGIINMDLENLYDNSLQTVEDMVSKNKRIKIFKEKLVLEEYIRRIKVIVEHHQLVLSEKVEVCFTDMLFIQYMCSAFLLCSILVQLANSEIGLISLLPILSSCMAVTFQIYVNCFYGNEVKIESGKISEAAYFSNWQNLGRDSYKARKYVLLLMIRAEIPTTIAVGKFGYLDLDSFVTLVKASYSYFNFLATTN